MKCVRNKRWKFMLDFEFVDLKVLDDIKAFLFEIDNIESNFYIVFVFIFIFIMWA